MIKLIRVDDRLLHGQVAFTWTPALSVDCILIANDRIANDEFLRMTLGLAKPASTKLFMKTLKETVSWVNDPKNAGFKLLILVESIKDLHQLCAGLPEIRSANLGGIRAKTGARAVSKAIALTEKEVEWIRELLQQGIELEVRQVPTDKKQLIENLI
jgi:mannose/fructose/N-acetylgalactosamine-specific phosphotransferase system component IIB